MGSSILQLVQDAADDPALSLTRPSTLFPIDDDGDTSPRKLLRALTRTTHYLAGIYDWQVLRKEQSFTTVNQETQTSAVPNDFLRFVPETFWNRTMTWKVTGPLSPADWQGMKARMQTSVVPQFTQRGNAILFSQVPTTGQTCAFEYIRKIVGFATDGTTARNRFTADTDTTLWDDELVTQGVILQYRKGERFDYAQDDADFQLLMANSIKQDGGRRVINMGGRGNSAQSRIDQARSSVAVVNNPQTWGGVQW
jgi:hypothetical protein